MARPSKGSPYLNEQMVTISKSSKEVRKRLEEMAEDKDADTPSESEAEDSEE